MSEEVSSPGIAIAFSILGWLSLISGIVISFVGLSSGTSTGAAGFAAGIGVVFSGLVLLAFAFALTKLHQIEIHLRGDAHTSRVSAAKAIDAANI